MARKKYSENFERDWNWYNKYKDEFTFSGALPKDVEFDKDGKTAKECFHRFDSEGKLLPCSEPELLQQIFNCKGAINMMIKEWGTDLTKGYLINFKEIKEEFELLDWMVTAVERTSVKVFKELDDNRKNVWTYDANAYIKDVIKTLRENIKNNGYTAKPLEFESNFYIEYKLPFGLTSAEINELLNVYNVRYDYLTIDSLYKELIHLNPSLKNIPYENATDDYKYDIIMSALN